jgi:enterochelin esterase family protein
MSSLPLKSNRLESLQTALVANEPDALDQFWREIAAQGTPLFESMPDNSGDEQMLATFLWHGNQDTQHVLLLSTLLGWPSDLSANKLDHLADTDVWYRTVLIRRDVRTTYSFSPNDPLQLPQDHSSFMEWATGYWHTDPLNRSTFLHPADDDDPSDRPVRESIISGPDAAAEPYVAERSHVARGKVDLERFTSQRLNNTRRVWIYTPPGYQASGEPYPWLLVFDGLPYQSLIPTPTILDNLLTEGKIPPLVAVLINSEGMSRNVELPCNEDFAAMIAEELLPWLQSQLHLASDPSRNVVAGSSLGGLAAAWLGYRHPEIFGNVLSQSGSYQWRQPDDLENGWLFRKYIAAETLPLRFYLDAGLLENIDYDGLGTSLLGSNRHFRDVLLAKGYPVTFATFSGGHDPLWWRQTLADGLIALLGHASDTKN